MFQWRRGTGWERGVVGSRHPSFWKQRSPSGPFSGPLSALCAPMRARMQGPGPTVPVPGKGQSSPSPVRRRSSAPPTPPPPHLACLHCSHSSCPRLHAGLSSLLSSPCSGLCASFSDSPGLCPEAGGATGLADWGRAETQLPSHGTGSSISSGVYSCAHPVFVEVVQK